MGRVFPRTRTGCLTCRQRKKKCDELKPQCQACERNRLDCAWPPHIRRVFDLNHDQKRSRNWDSNVLEVVGESPTETSAECACTSLAPGASHQGKENIELDEVVWSWGLTTFLSPIRAGMLFPESHTLLSHYLESTAPKLAPAPDVPFVFWVMPVAYNDDLLMHSILALGGAHLSYRSHENTDIQRATCRHYSLALRNLRKVTENETLLRQPLVLLRVILTVMILCHHEVILGNLNGSPFTHLRACRHLVLGLRERHHQIKTASERKLYGFVMELYCYIVLSNTITPFGMNCNRTLAHDSFLQSLDDLRDFGAFGVMFSGGHSLFEMISSISLFAVQKESERSTGQDTDPERYSIYKELKSRMMNWNSLLADSSEHDLLSGRNATLEISRQALLVFLETAISPFSKYDLLRICHLQPLLDVAMSYLPQALPSKYSCIILWSLMIIGSCLVEDYQRRAMKNILVHNHYLMRNTVQASTLLEFLWCDPDEYAIGPYGLGLMMEKHGLNYGVI